MKIIYLINDTYQVVSEDEQTIYFQGSKDECKKLIKKQKKNDELRSKLFTSTILQRN
jgi:hypothetical protein